MPRAWITGAKGFIGRHCALRFRSGGYWVSGIGHGAWREGEADAWGVECWINGDITQSNCDLLGEKAGTPDTIVHLAGSSSVHLSLQAPGEDFHRSVLSTLQLLEWARRYAPGASIVIASSAAVYGASHMSAIRESDEIAPCSPYGYHKRIAELLISSYSSNFALRSALVRLFSVYGNGLRKQLLWDLCRKMARNPDRVELAGDGAEARDWLHVSDAVEYLWLAVGLAQPQAPIVNGGRGIAVSIREVAQLAASVWGFGGEIVFTGERRAGDPTYLVADMKKAHSMGFASTTGWKSGIAEYVRWFKSVEGIASA